MKKIFAILLITGVIFSCKKKEEETAPDETPTTTGTTAEEGFPDSVWTATGTGPRLIFKFKFDSTQARLDAFGNPTPLPSGHGAYSPVFNQMAAHYIELAPTDFDSLGKGIVLYHAEETTAGGAKAIRFSKSVVVRENVVFYSSPLSQITPGMYKWLRLSLSYQNYDIPYKMSALPGNHIATGTVSSFLGYKTYVTKYKIKDKVFTPSFNPGVGGPNVYHPQGYWGFESNLGAGYYYIGDGQAPAGSTTVVNPNFANSPIPAGSCVVTAQFANMFGANQMLNITGAETQDIVITVSLSTNKSFEWIEVGTPDGHYQPEQPYPGETPVDMGVRGMIPKVQY